ncbi:hypothetical protein, partial [Klebsiella pneumoniae]|uniref:hypothetical protein n=1 Tax=Klebsiella pneumoniae TaxID=573 RepID=UPI0022AF48E9
YPVIIDLQKDINNHCVGDDSFPQYIKSTFCTDLFKVIPLILPLEENFIQPEHYPNQSDNQ